MTDRPAILLVEDNHITRRLERAALERAGFRVVEAADAKTALERMSERPALVVLDLLLPDADGFEVAERLRALPEGVAIPIIACSGFLSRFDDSRIAAFDDFLPKPVEPERLVRTVRAHLPTRPAKVSPRRERVLVIDDDPAQLKLTCTRLQFAGFRVQACSSGADGLAAATKEPPDAVLTDALMPGMDGFQVCIAMRRDPRLRAVPIFLHSATYLDDADRKLARDAGANGFAMKTDDFQKVVDLLLAGMEGKAPAVAEPVPGPPLAQVEAARLDRVSHQVDRLALSNAQLARRSTQQAAQLVILSSIASALSRSARENEALHEIFANTLDACGVSRGVLCTVGGRGVEVRSAAGLSAEATSRLCPMLADEAVKRALGKAEAGPLPSSEPWAAPILEVLGARHGVLIPIVSGGRPLGGILLASDNEDLTAPHFLTFVNTVGAQIGQALALVDTFSLLSASEQRYRALFEGSPLPTWVYDRDTGRVLDVNEVALQRYGYSREEWARMTVSDVRVEDGRPGPTPGPLDFALRKHRRKDGGVIDVEIRSHDVQLEGKTVRLAVANDVTDRLRAEEDLRRSQEQLRQAQKMEAIGTLAAGVAHDINNVLSVVLSYSGVVLDELPPEGPLRGDMREIVTACERAAGIVRQLLLISRQHKAEPRAIDLNEIVSGMDKMLRRIVGVQVDVRLLPGEKLGSVWGDAGHLEQVLLNLAVNARDAMPRGGRLVIETSNVEVGAEGPVAQGRYVLLQVSDTGEGMDAATRARIFEPFFTTKEPGKGTGLGLSTVLGIVRESKGHVEVQSAPGEGATFRFYFPRVEATAPREQRPAPAGIPRGAGETVLLVEDDDQVRAAVSTVLRRQGYRVLESPSVDGALLAIERHEQSIHLLVTDVVLPAQSGVELAERLRASRPEMKVLFVSGHTEETLGRYREKPGHHFLQKPLSPAALVRKVGELLRQGE